MAIEDIADTIDIEAIVNESVANITGEQNAAGRGEDDSPSAGPPEGAEGAQPSPEQVADSDPGAQETTSTEPSGASAAEGEDGAAGTEQDGKDSAGDAEPDEDDKRAEQAILSKEYAAFNRKRKSWEKKSSRREEELEQKAQQLEQQAVTLENIAQKHGERFKQWDSNPYEQIRGYLESRGVEWNQYVMYINQNYSETGANTQLVPQKQQASSEVSELRQTVQQLVQQQVLQNESLSYRSRLMAAYPRVEVKNITQDEKAEAIEIAMQRAAAHRQAGNAFPDPEEILLALDDEVGYVKYKQGKTSQSPATVQTPAPSADTVSSPPRDPKALPRTITQSDAGERATPKSDEDLTWNELLEKVEADVSAGRYAQG